jgi:hypothetical protein
LVASLSTLMDNIQRLKKYSKIYVPYDLLVNIAGKAPRTYCDVLLSMMFSYCCMMLRLQSERQIPVRYI